MNLSFNFSLDDVAIAAIDRFLNPPATEYNLFVTERQCQSSSEPTSTSSSEPISTSSSEPTSTSTSEPTSTSSSTCPFPFLRTILRILSTFLSSGSFPSFTFSGLMKIFTSVFPMLTDFMGQGENRDRLVRSIPFLTLIRDAIVRVRNAVLQSLNLTVEYLNTNSVEQLSEGRDVCDQVLINFISTLDRVARIINVVIENTNAGNFSFGSWIGDIIAALLGFSNDPTDSTPSSSSTDSTPSSSSTSSTNSTPSSSSTDSADSTNSTPSSTSTSTDSTNLQSAKLIGRLLEKIFSKSSPECEGDSCAYRPEEKKDPVPEESLEQEQQRVGLDIESGLRKMMQFFEEMISSAPQESAPQESAPQESAPQESAPQESAPQESAPQETRRNVVVNHELTIESPADGEYEDA